jgi:hypothetical protein
MADKVKENKAKSVMDWLYIHRLIVVIGGIFLIAIVVLITIYISLYLDTRRISFENDVNEKPVYVSEFDSMDDIDYVDIEYNFLKQDTILSDGGSYTIEFILNDLAVNRIKDISVTVLVHSKWVRDYSFVSTRKTLSMNDSGQDVIINYDKKLPDMPLLFVFLDSPDLYLKFDITYTDTGLETFYIKDTSILGTTPLEGFNK